MKSAMSGLSCHLQAIAMDCSIVQLCSINKMKTADGFWNKYFINCRLWVTWTCWLMLFGSRLRRSTLSSMLDRSSCFSYCQGKSWFEMDAIFFIPVVRGAANIVDCYLIVSNCTERSVFALKLSQHDRVFFYKCKTNGWAEMKECKKERQITTWKEAMLFQVN